jgi:integrase
MARKIHSADIETRTARLKLPIAKKPIFVRASPGVGLGYRRNRAGGTWVVRAADGRGGNWTRAFAIADDFEDANGSSVLDYWQAQDRARAIARSAASDELHGAEPATVAEAIDAYEADIKTRGGDLGNVARLRAHLPTKLGAKQVAELTVRDLRAWRDGLVADRKPATVNRTSTAFKAALNLAAENDARISARRAWQTGLAPLPDAEESRNVILPDDQVCAIVSSSYKEGEEFGLFVEVAAETGARPSQLARIEVQDLQAERSDPRLMMPSSRKGRGKRKVTRRPVPIPGSLAQRLCAAATARLDISKLLVNRHAEPWEAGDHSEPFKRVVKAVGLDPAEVTLYALRHSSVVRQLLRNVPIRIVAVNHDTSVAMLEKTYSRYIGDHSDAIARAALLDVGAGLTANLVPAPADVNPAE